MKSIKLASRYAKALFEFVLEQQKIEEVYQDILSLEQIILQNHELSAVLKSPIIHPSTKKTVFRAVFAQNISNITLKFFEILITKRREPIILTIASEYQKIYRAYHHIKIAELTTAVPITETIRIQLLSLLSEQTGSKIELKESIDPNIIGGLIVKIDDNYFDASLKGKIDKLKTMFGKNVYQTSF